MKACIAFLCALPASAAMAEEVCYEMAETVSFCLEEDAWSYVGNGQEEIEAGTLFFDHSEYPPHVRLFVYSDDNATVSERFHYYRWALENRNMYPECVDEDAPATCTTVTWFADGVAPSRNLSEESYSYAATYPGTQPRNSDHAHGYAIAWSFRRFPTTDILIITKSFGDRDITAHHATLHELALAGLFGNERAIGE